MDSFAYGITYFMIILYSWVGYLISGHVYGAYTVLMLCVPVMFFMDEIGSWLRKKGL